MSACSASRSTSMNVPTGCGPIVSEVDARVWNEIPSSSQTRAIRTWACSPS